MKAKFCEETLDILLILSEEEASQIKRDDKAGAVPFLTAKNRGYIFSLMNSANMRNDIQVIEPHSSQHSQYYIKISDSMYAELLRHKRIGTRYASASKVSIAIDSEVTSS